MSASSGEVGWLTGEMHPALAVAVFFAITVAALVFAWMVTIIVPTAPFTTHHMVGVAGTLGGVLLGWHLRRVTESGHSDGQEAENDGS